MKTRDILFITALSALLFMPFLGRVHLFDWDEINFAEAAREMLETGIYNRVTINYEVFTEKPPFFFWVQALSMKIFGVNEFAARFPNALLSILTLISLYIIGSKLNNEKFGRWWAIIYMASLLPHMHFKSGIIDPLFNFFMFIGIYHGFQMLLNTKAGDENRKKTYFHATFSGLAIGMAILTKGPVGLLLPFLSLFIFWLIHISLLQFKLKHFLFIIFTTAILPVLWYGAETIKYGPEFITEFIQRNIDLFSTEDAGHGGPFYYHWVVVLLGVFPASAFMFGAFIRNQRLKELPEDMFKRLMVITLLVVLIIFSIVKTKIIHYSSLSYFPITFLAAMFIYDLTELPFLQQKKWHVAFTGLIGLILAAGFILTPIAFLNPDSVINYIDDPFAKEALFANGNWKISDTIPGIVLFIIMILFIVFSFLRKFKTALIYILIFSCIIIWQSALYTLTPKVEKHSQNAAIEFYKSKQNEDCYVEVHGFKSYAHLFYTKKKPPENNKNRKLNWMLKSGKLDKPLYLVVKIQKAENIKEWFGLEELYRKNGFVFLKKEKEI